MFSQNPFQGCVHDLDVVQLRPPPGKQKVLLAIMFPLDFCLWKGNVLHLGRCKGDLLPAQSSLQELLQELQEFDNPN